MILRAVLLLMFLGLPTSWIHAAEVAAEGPDELPYAVRLRREGRYEQAKPVFIAWLKKHPDDPQANFDYAYSLSLQAAAETNATDSKKMRKEAYEHAAKAKKLGLNNPVLPLILNAIDEEGRDLTDPRVFSANPAAADLVKRGEQKFAANEKDEALKLYQEALSLDPKSYHAALFGGDVYFSEAKLDEAVSWFTKAIEINPNAETAYRYLGDALAKLGRNSEARDRYVDAVVAEPYNRLPREMLQRFATSRRLLQERREVAVPRLKIEAKDGKMNVGYDPADGPIVLSYALARAKWLTDERKNYFPATAAPRHSLPEECYGLRAILTAAEELAKKDPAALEKMSATLATLKLLEDSGLLEAFVLLDRADAGIAEDYPAYRLQHRAELVRYIQTAWLRAAPATPQPAPANSGTK
jgi:tetratricopeptide (TPR) repeat protein